MKPLRLAVLASGGGSNFQSIIDAVEGGELDSTIECLISNKEDAYALERARKHKIKDIYIAAKDPKDSRSYDERLLSTLEEVDPDLIVLAGYLKIISAEMIDRYPGQIINIHPSLLPKYGGKGCYGIHVHKAVLEAGDKVSGATVHYVDKGIDTGEIILQKSVEVLDTDTAKTLQERVLKEVEHKIYVEAIKKIANT